MQNENIEMSELDAQSVALLPDRETLCYVGCVNLNLNLANITTVQAPVAVAIGGDANAYAQNLISSIQGNYWS